MIDEELLRILVCPADRGPLVLVDDTNDQLLYNPRLRRAYRIEDNIPVLLVDEAVEVEGGRPSEAARGSFGEVTGPRGGLTVSGMVPGAFSSVAANSDGPGPASERPVLPLGTLAANTRCMPPSMPVFS